MGLLARFRTEAAQEQGPMVRLSRLVIDPSALELQEVVLERFGVYAT
jgi:hypothetical protein